ncbi:ABC transporter substrate-binding protein [Ornithinibacillus xuwenensis]|uniref:ABC transporter substrate-binding protein n=1 Tax=Ornithinibacillus xuwenensis TaxID=3144668 RepID=A0ABU9XPW8_9BACI
MTLIGYYIQLFMTFSRNRTNEPIKLSRSMLSNELNCSERNVIHILNKMEEKEWILRKSGKGRGNLSTISFQKGIGEIIDCLHDSSSYHQDLNKLLSYLDHHQLFEKNKQLAQSLFEKLFGVIPPNQYAGEIDQLRIPYFRSILSLDPSDVERQTERHMVEQLFNTLVVFDTERQEVKPCISHYWESSHDDKVWTFYIRKGISFHHEKYVEAEDVKFTFERLKDTPAKWITRYIEKIICLDKHIIQFQFAISNRCWPLLLCSPKCAIIPVDYGNKSKEAFAREPIGTGPYKVMTHNRELLRLSVHHAYFKGRAHMDEISIHIMPSVENYFTQ